MSLQFSTFSFRASLRAVGSLGHSKPVVTAFLKQIFVQRTLRGSKQPLNERKTTHLIGTQPVGPVLVSYAMF